MLVINVYTICFIPLHAPPPNPPNITQFSSSNFDNNFNRTLMEQQYKIGVLVMLVVWMMLDYKS